MYETSSSKVFCEACQKQNISFHIQLIETFASIGSPGTIKMTRLNNQAIVREKYMKQAHLNCSVKLVKSRCLILYLIDVYS